MSKDYNIFIVDNETEVLNRFKKFLDNHNLYLFNGISSALEFMNTEKFRSIDLAILDDDIGKGMKISGLNLAYKIIKKKNYPAIILCDSLTDSENLNKMADIIDAVIYKKPIEPSIKLLLPDVIANHKMKQITTLEQFIREFITGVELLKEFILNDEILKSGLGNFIKEIQKVEDRIIPGMNFFLNKRETGQQQYLNKPNVNEFHTDIHFYVKTLTTIVETLLTRNYQLLPEFVSLFQEINELGNTIILEIKKIKG